MTHWVTKCTANSWANLLHGDLWQHGVQMRTKFWDKEREVFVCAHMEQDVQTECDHKWRVSGSRLVPTPCPMPELLGPYKDLSGSYYHSAYSGGHRFTWVRSVAKALFTNGKVGCKLSSSHSVSRKGLRFRHQVVEYRMGTHTSTAISLLSPFSSPSVPETEAPKWQGSALPLNSVPCTLSPLLF